MRLLPAISTVAVAGAFLLVAVSSAGATPTSHCSWVWMTDQSTKAQVGAVKARLSKDRSVRAFRVVTPAQLLEAMRRKYPELVDALPSNPFTAQFRIRLREGVDADQFVVHYRALKLKGVDRIGLSYDTKPCLAI